MIIYVDIDGTICTTTLDNDYSKATPILDRIEKINHLYDGGNTIIYWTARGSVSGIDWQELTENQLKQWGAKHHDCKLGKPHFDLYVCDKVNNALDFFSE
jgi:dTDP-glucose 4,6-dehydratase